MTSFAVIYDVICRYFKLRQYIVDLNAANLDRLSNQNAGYKKVALECGFNLFCADLKMSLSGTLFKITRNGDKLFQVSFAGS